MSPIKSATAFALLGLLIGSVPCLASTTQLLCIQDGSYLTTYSVNSTRAVSKKLATLYLNADPCYGIQLVPSGSFLYIVGFTSATEEYIWVHALTSAGVAAVTPTQKLAVKPALYGLIRSP